MPLDVEKHILYWITGADEALQTAELLIANGRYSFGLFFIHLAIEKMLKALVTQHTCIEPPKTHNLILLTERAGLTPPAEILLALADFRAYCMEGRYPDSRSASATRTLAHEELPRAKEVYQWLHQQLNK